LSRKTTDTSEDSEYKEDFENGEKQSSKDFLFEDEETLSAQPSDIKPVG
jgi:hypothetical protein